MYSRIQRFAMTGYIVFAIVALLFLHRGIGRHTSSPFDLILGAPIPFGFGIFAVQNGWISTRYSNVDRNESPVSYWFYVTLALGIGAGMFIWGFYAALRLTN
jgi:hypothetical protein